MLTAIPLSHHGASSGLTTVQLILVIWLWFYVSIALGWGIFRKAGRHWWEALIPLWSYWVFCRIIRGSPWFLLLIAIPFLNIIGWLVLLYDLARSFSKRWAWFWGLTLVPIVFFPILSLSGLEYLGPAGDPSARDAYGRITRR